MNEQHGTTDADAADDDDIESAVIAADDTGMVRSEALLVEAEMEGRLTPPGA